MVNPGIFQGSRKTFLESQIPQYKAGVAGGYRKDAIAIIQRSYFKRYPVELPLDQEPTPEHLAQVNDDDPEPEQEDIDPDLSHEEYEREKTVRAERSALISKRKDQIARWLGYRHMKETDVDVGPDNPYRILLFQLTGKGLEKPRQKTARNVWRKTHRQEIEVLAKERQEQAKKDGRPPKRGVTVRDQVTKDLFVALDAEEKTEWEDRAKEEHKAALEEYERARTAPPSTAPEDRQRCIQGLTSFVKPILDLICEATGWKASLIAGGPEPASEGRLNIMSIHAGESRGDVKMNFGRAHRPFYKKHFVPAYGNFLKTCYTPEECRERALTQENVLEPLDNQELDDAGVDLDQVAWNRLSATPAPDATQSRTVDPMVNTAATRATDNSILSTVATTNSHPSSSEIGNTVIHPVVDATNAETEFGPTQDLPQANTATSSRPSLQSPGFSHMTHLFSIPPSPPPFDGITPPISPSPVDPAPSLASRKRRPQSPLNNDTLIDSGGTSALPSASTAGSHSAPQKRRRIADVALTSASANLPPQSLNTTLPSVVASSAVAPSAAASVPPEVDESAPIWFRDGCRMFESVGMGDSWAGLIREWKRFEFQEKYQDTPRLKSTHRPDGVGLWIKNYRKPTWRPSSINPEVYCSNFAAWWACLQPPWRLNDEGQIEGSRTEGDWECLRRSGTNGIIGILVALLFWLEGMEKANNVAKQGGKGSASASSKADHLREKWDWYVLDVTLALRNLPTPSK